MGIIVTDNYELDSGMTTTSHYVRIQNIKIEKIASNIQCEVEISGYASKDAAASGRSKLYENSTGTVFSGVPNENIYSNLYNCVKKLYTNYTDDI
jgi:hypothetical protein